MIDALLLGVFLGMVQLTFLVGAFWLGRRDVLNDLEGVEE